jgi:uracil-DNA glycosylase
MASEKQSRTNRFEWQLERKNARLGEPHIAEFAQVIGRWRRRGYKVPNVDPDSAGTGARILILGESPGYMTLPGHGSGFISVDNDDPSADNFWHLMRDVGLERDEFIAWNVVPWYVGSTSKHLRSADILEGQPALRAFIGLLPELRVVVPLGRKAQRGWAMLGSDLPTFPCPHPSPLSVNRGEWVRDEIRASLREAKRVADGRGLRRARRSA